MSDFTRMYSGSSVLPYHPATIKKLGGVFAARRLARPDIGCGAMVGAVRFPGVYGPATKTEVFVLRIANRPPARLGRKVSQREDPRIFLHFDLLRLTLDGRRTAFQAKAMGFADNGILRDGKAFADLARGQAFLPKLLQSYDFFVSPTQGRSPLFTRQKSGPYSGPFGVSTRLPHDFSRGNHRFVKSKNVPRVLDFDDPKIGIV